MAAICYVFKEITAVFETEDVGAYEVHCGGHPELVDVDSSLGIRCRGQDGKEFVVEDGLSLGIEGWRIMDAGF